MLIVMNKDNEKTILATLRDKESDILQEVHTNKRDLGS